MKTCARWCKIRPDGTCSWDETKIKSSLSQDELENAGWKREVIEGRVLSARVYPLIFTVPKPDAPDLVRFRTLSYFSELVGDPDGISPYQSLSLNQRRIVAVGIRDLYIAEAAGLLSQPEKDILQGMVNIIDQDPEELQLGGLRLSFHPSMEFSIIKFIENLNKKIGEETSRLYAQAMATPKLFVVFVNPADLSYHNFENIIHLDPWFESNITPGPSDLNLTLSDTTQVKPTREVFTYDLQGDMLHHLKALSELDLYVPPLNKGTRGGERFIFHSSLFSRVLTEALRSSDVLDKLSGGQLKPSFEFVNYVFRCNRFNTDDSPFPSHLDTPYYDSSRSHISKYTMLINLATGHNDPALRIEDVSFSEARRFKSTDEIWSTLSSVKAEEHTGVKHLKQSDVESLIKKGPTKPLEWQFEDWDGEPEELEEFDEDGDGCCLMHSFPMFNPWKNNEVMEAYDVCRDYARKKLFGAPILILDQEIVINKANIEIVGDKLFFLQSKGGTPLPRINFAACWADGIPPSEFVVVGKEIDAPGIIVPPLTFHESPEGYQFSLDFFRNDWMVKVDDQAIPLPDVSERPEPDIEFRSRVPDPSIEMKDLFDYPSEY
ncbi:hypothetical protein ACHAPT_006464 [Fusarium lateritium]